jgi:hypothetical protein
VTVPEIGSILHSFSLGGPDAGNKVAFVTPRNVIKPNGPKSMDDSRQDVLVAKALAVARVRALRLSLLGLHKALIDTERRRYERDHGRIENPHAALRLVLEAPAFQWLHPLAEVIVQMDEKLADEGAIGVAEAEAFVDRVRNLLHGDGNDRFREEYRRTLQDAPEVVMAHAEVARRLLA